MTYEDTIDLVRALRLLDKRRRYAFLTHAQGVLLADIAADLGLSRARAGQLVKEAVLRIRGYYEVAPPPPPPLPAVTEATLKLVDEAYERAKEMLREREEARQAELLHFAARQDKTVVRCAYPHCPTPKRAVRSGRMHAPCRALAHTRARALRRWDRYWARMDEETRECHV